MVKNYEQTITGQYSFFNLGLWLLLALIIPACGGALTFKEVCLGSLQLVCSWSLGILMLKRVTAVTELSGITRNGLALLLGSFPLHLLSLIPLTTPQRTIVCLLLMAIVLYFAVRSGHINLGVTPIPDLAALIGAFVASLFVSIGNGDLTRALARFPLLLEERVYDSAFFTAIVATMRHGTISSAIYEEGTPVSYQIWGLVPPANFAFISGAPSHVALWGVWMPLFKILGLLLIAEASGRLMGFGGRKLAWGRVISVIAFILLQPLHPIYLFKGEPENFIWSGLGFLGPGGNVPSTAGIIWTTVTIVVAFPAVASHRLSRSNIVLLILILGTFPIVKVPMFFVTGVFLTAVGVSRVFKGDKTLLIAVILAAPVSVVAYSWAFRGPTTGVNVDVGYLPGYFAQLFGSRGNDSRTLLLGSLVGAALFIVWGGIRWLGVLLLSLERGDPSSLARRRECAAATILALSAACLVATVLKIAPVQSPHATSGDLNFNLLQFPRHAFLIVSIAGMAGLIGWILSHNVSRWQRLLGAGVCGLWCLLALISLSISNSNAPRVTTPAWIVEARNELRSIKPERIVVDPSPIYPGLLLAASDVGKFWISETAEGGTAPSTVNAWRWTVIGDGLSPDLERRAHACGVIKDHRVDTIVATPETEHSIQRFAQECGFTRLNEHRWIWRAVPERFIGTNVDVSSTPEGRHD